MSEIEKPFFDYNSVPDKHSRAVLRQQSTAIKAAFKRTQNDIIEIGRRLIDAKAEVDHGLFMKWVQGEFGMSYRHAHNFMQVAEVFGKMENFSTLSFPNSALFALAAPSVSDETREVAIEMNAAGDVTTLAETKELIEAGKPPETTGNDQAKVENFSTLDADLSTNPDNPGDNEEPDGGEFDGDEFDLPEDEEAPEVDGYGRPIPGGVYVETTTETMNADLPEEPAAPAKLSKAEEDALPDTDWLKTLPLLEKLCDEKIPTVLFTTAALNYRKLEKQIGALRRAVDGAVDDHHSDEFSKAMRAVAAVPPPSRWIFSRERNGGFQLW